MHDPQGGLGLVWFITFILVVLVWFITFLLVALHLIRLLNDNLLEGRVPEEIYSIGVHGGAIEYVNFNLYISKCSFIVIFSLIF